MAILAGVALVIAGAPAMASTGLDGPTTPKTGDPIESVANQNEIQKITVLDATDGTFRVTYADATRSGCQSDSIAWNAIASAVDTAL